MESVDERPEPTFLTARETLILHMLGDVWKEALRLPITHPDQIQEFRHTIHRLQDMIMARPHWSANSRASHPDSS